MNKEQFLLQLAQGLHDIDSFARGAVLIALEQAYTAGAASTQTAPTVPRELTSQVCAVTDANCTVQAVTGGHPGLTDKIEVCVDRLDKGRLFIYIPLKFVDDTEYLYEHCKAQRVDVFKAIVEAVQEVKRLLG